MDPEPVEYLSRPVYTPTELFPEPTPVPARQPVVKKTQLVKLEVPTSPPVEVENVTAIIVNYKTLWLAKRAYQSLLNYYKLRIILVDNGSGDAGTTKWIQYNGGICNEHNLGHGPAMHAAVARVKTPYFLTLDSDCTVKAGGWLVEMVKELEQGKLYAIGWLRYVDRLSGVPLEWHLTTQPPEKFVPYIHPAVGLYRTDKYRELRGFVNHGAPALLNMVDAQAKGWPVKGFPVFNHVDHMVAGTRRMYGGRWDPKDGDRPNKWKEGGSWPI